MELVFETNLNYEKCGEILTAFNEEKRVFALKCFFCEKHCESLADFIAHIEQKHGSELSATFTKKEQEDVDTSFYDWDNDYNGNIERLEVKIEVEHEDNQTNFSNEGDPLNDSTTNVKPTESSKQTRALNKRNIKTEEGDESYNEALDNVNDFSADSDSDRDYVASECSEESEKPEEENQELDIALITAYEAIPLLWDKKVPNARDRQQRRDAHKKIVTELSEKFGKQLKWTNLEKRIKALRKIYANEVLRSKSEGDKFKPSWVFSKLEFLKDTIQLTKSTKRLKGEKLSLINNEQHLIIIEIYEKYPCLYDSWHVGYRSKSQRENAIKEMLTLIEEKAQLKITDDDLQKRLYRIRLACTKEKIRKLKCEELNQPYEPVCKTYSKLTFLFDHVQPFKCKECPETFKSCDQYKIHKSTHDGSNPFTCPICQKGFTSVANVTLHVRRHTHDYPFVCKVCEKGFATSNELSIHSRQHTGEKPYFCESCGKSFRTRSSFCRHKLRHEKRPIHFCKLCKKGFYEKTRLDEHMNAHYGVRNKVCKICGKKFSSLKNLWQHKLIHSGKRKYVCKICGKDFVQNAGLNKHLKSHETATSRVNKISNKLLEEEKKKFPCEHCNKRFAQKIRRKIHMKNVHNIVVSEPDIEKNKFSCDVCGKQFNFNAGLHKHLRVHEPKMPKMNSHKRKRLPAEKNLKCEICLKKYAHEKRLNKHLQNSHHGILQMQELTRPVEERSWFYQN